MLAPFDSRAERATVEWCPERGPLARVERQPSLGADALAHGRRWAQPRASITAAARSGIMISWWPMSVYPRPLPAVGRVTTLVCARYERTKSRFTVVRPASAIPLLRARATAFRNTSGKTTAEPQLRYTPCSRRATFDTKYRKSRRLPSPSAAPEAAGC